MNSKNKNPKLELDLRLGKIDLSLLELGWIGRKLLVLGINSKKKLLNSSLNSQNEKYRTRTWIRIKNAWKFAALVHVWEDHFSVPEDYITNLKKSCFDVNKQLCSIILLPTNVNFSKTTFGNCYGYYLQLPVIFKRKKKERNLLKFSERSSRILLYL